MKQKDVTKKAFYNAAALVENMDLEQLYGEYWLEANPATDEQLTKGQQAVVETLRRRATK